MGVRQDDAVAPPNQTPTVLRLCTSSFPFGGLQGPGCPALGRVLLRSSFQGWVWVSGRHGIMGPDGGDAARAAGACGSEGTTHTGRRARANHGHTGGMRGRTVPGAVPLGHCFAVAASGWPNGMVPALRPVCGGVHEGTTPPSPFDLRTTTALRDRAPAQRYSLPSGRRRLAPNSRFGCRGQAKVFSFPLTWTALVGGCAVGVAGLVRSCPLALVLSEIFHLHDCTGWAGGSGGGN